jgi:hypothetical protein
MLLWKILPKMSEQELNKILSDTVWFPAETEIVEFKIREYGTKVHAYKAWIVVLI